MLHGEKRNGARRSTAVINRKCKDKITTEDRNMLSDNYRDMIYTTGQMNLLVD
jgi:hypothetical protein